MASLDNIRKALKKKGLDLDEIIERNGTLYNVHGEDYAPTVTMKPTATISAANKDDIAPVDDSWFKKGLFDDGYQFGDVTRTILGTGMDLGEEISEGILEIGENVVDAGAYVVGGVGGLFGADDFKNDMQDFIAKDLYDSEALIKKSWKIGGGYGLLGVGMNHLVGDVEKASVLGEKSEGLANSAGQLGATIALQSVGVPWWVTTGVTSFGSEVDNAFNQGASYGEAGLSAAITAGAEILTEKISGGIRFGGKTLDAGLTKQLATSISNRTVRTLSKLGLDMAGEGFEEVLSGAASAIGQKLTYADDKELSELFSSEDAWDSFIGGAVLGGGMNSVNVVKNKVQSKKDGVKYDSTTGLTVAEESVFNSEYNKRIEEATKDGKKPNSREQNKIYDEVMDDLSKGRISIDSIEESLGGETFKTYQDTVSKEDSLQKEFDTLKEEYDSLYKMKNGEKSDEQIDRQKELKQRIEAMKPQVDALKTDSQRGQLKQKLSEEVLNIAKSSPRLAESYNEKARRSEAFKADLSKYSEKQKQTIQKAIDSGILNNTNRTHEFVDLVAKISADKGVSFNFTDNAKLKESGFAIEGKTINGFVTAEGVTVNIQSAKALNSIVGHEITHVLEGTELYQPLQEALKQYAETKGEYKSRLEAIQKLYAGVEGADINAELTADLVGDYLFTDSDFINKLSTENRNVFQKIYDEIKYLAKVATAGSAEARQLEKAKKAFEKAYRENVTAEKNTDTKFSLSVDSSGKTVYNASEESKGDVSYVRTDEFRSLQAEVQRMSVEESEMFHSGDRTIDDGLRGRFSRSVRGLFLDAGNNGGSDGNALLTLTDKKSGNQFNIHQNVNGELFHDVFEIARSYLRNGELVDLHDVNTSEDGIGYNETYNFLSDDGLSGFSITPDGDLISVFNLNDKKGFLRAISDFVKTNAKTLDCYNSPVQPLMEIYKSVLGFKTASVMEYNMEYDHDNIAKNHGMPHIAFMVNTTQDIETRYFGKDEYNEAVEYRNSFVEEAISPLEKTSSADGVFFDGKNNSNVNTKFSISDSDGKQLTKGQQEYFKDSKVRDEDGSLKVMYHGSTNAGFHEFSQDFSDDSTSLFFVDNPKVAESYSGTSEIYTAKTLQTAEDLNAFFAEIGATEYSAVETDGTFTLLEDGDEVATSDTAPGLYEEFRDWTGLGEGSVNYKVYLNLTNPLTVDAEGRQWNELPPLDENTERYDYIKVVDVGDTNGQVTIEYAKNTDISPVTETVDLYEKFGDGIATRLSDLAPGESIENIPVQPTTTRDYAQYAKENGYDGVIFNNIHDTGVYADGTEGASTVAIAFEGNQVKSVANEKPSGDADIRFSLSEDSKGRELSPAVKTRFENSKVVDDDGNLKAVYHGTASGEFTIFDKAKGSVEGDFGSGFYFTDNEADVSEHYEGGGPDFDNKVARRAEQIEADEEIDYEEAKKKARQELYQGGHKFEVYLNIENPAIVGETRLLDSDSYLSEYDESDYVSYDDYIADVEQLVADDIENIVWEVEKNVDLYSTDGIADVLYEAYYEGGIGIEELKAKINDLYLEDNNGNLAGNEVTRQIIESLGYDGIIDSTVSTKWNMDIEEGTTHYIVFKPNQIKSVTNENPTDNPDIHRSLSNMGETPQRYGNYNVYGSDVALETNQDIAPMSEAVTSEPSELEALLTQRDEVVNRLEAAALAQNNEEMNRIGAEWSAINARITELENQSDIAPVDETDAETQERLASFTDADAPIAREDVEFYETPDTTRINDKTLKSIAKSLKSELSLSNAESLAMQEVIQKYSTSENMTSEDLFDEIAEKFGERSWTERQEDIADVKSALRQYGINVNATPEVKRDIPDYNRFQKSNFGKIRFSNAGMPIDIAYMELSNEFPGFFPPDITNPTDQLQKMAEVANTPIEVTNTVNVGDEVIQKAVDLITSEVARAKQAELQKSVESENRAAFDSLDDYAPIEEEDIAPVRKNAEAPKKRELFQPLEDGTIDSKIKQAQEIVDNKDKYISHLADGLYREIRGLKKGVRASKELGTILDYGYDWKTVKNALLNIKNHPVGMVNESSIPEQVAREMFNGKYEDAVYDLDALLYEKAHPPIQPIKTVSERLEAKLNNLRTELESNKTLREESMQGFDEEIARLQAEYSAKSNKNTKVANNILRRIERMRRLKANADADYSKRITNLEAKVAKAAEESRTGESATEQAAMRRELHQHITDKIKAVFAEKGFDFDKVLKAAKDLSTFATVDNTPQRVMEKALGYKEGQILADLTVNKVAENETQGIKWLSSFTGRKNGLLAQISKQYSIKPGSKESAAAQMYAEGFYVDHNNDIVQYGDNELAKDFPDAKVQENIKGLAKDTRIRQIYDETLDLINESRRRNGYPEIKKLDNYFLHFRAMDDTFSQLGIPFNPNDIKAKDLPADLSGITADLKPGQPYFSSSMHRTGQRTSFDLLGGIEQYLVGAKDQIYHIDDIQTLRALRDYVADSYGQAKGLEDLDLLSEEERQEKIKSVYNSHLSTFAKFLNEEANVIAGKTALVDRGLEGILGRRGIAFINTINRQVGANMVGFNISSSLTNFIAPVQAFAKANKAAFVKGFAQTVQSRLNSIAGKTDSFIENNPTMIRRQGADRFYRTPWQKVSDVGYSFMGAVDSISTEIIVRAKYNELIKKGMSEEMAIREADKWTSRLMGDRSLGQQPQIYNSKMLGLITKFQLEVRNQLDSQFYDTIQEAKVSNEDIKNASLRNAKTAAKVTSTLFQLAVAQHLFGKAFEAVAGYNPTFDIIGVLIKALGLDDDEESEDTVLDNIEQGFLELMGDLPYTSTFTGGRIPVASALPIEQFVTGKDSYGNEKSRWETLAETAPYYIMPGGYGQAKKTYQGLSMFDEDHPIAGSYTDSGNLRFPVEDNLANRIQAGIFGQWASGNARDYFDNERAPLKENQIQEFIDVEMPIEDYWAYREGLSGLKTTEEKVNYIASLDLSTWQKNILANNVLNRKDDVDLSGYGDYESYDEFNYATKNPEKYQFLKENGVSYSDYALFDEETKEAYTWAYNNPEKFKVSKVIASDVAVYRQYVNALNELSADKDEDGKTISGSRKEKVLDYINDLDAEYGEKIVLFKSEYPADDTYNYDIVDYLNSREDLSYSDVETILKELGFTVEADGTVRW